MEEKFLPLGSERQQRLDDIHFVCLMAIGCLPNHRGEVKADSKLVRVAKREMINFTFLSDINLSRELVDTC